ncbi:tRNA lysidine(34) synthetase TilS [Rhodohalobacter sp. SW132]|uniref:tRNA lysidine(34) synthetase TilS n=1 Tax=Rhodohalobacter sp. SW132 TaxID=2293433 RepID=UPI001314DA0B|nr:tRNA lysidine(34) synthetase TilS [Rhodohalobacter sp. SW132]
MSKFESSPVVKSFRENISKLERNGTEHPSVICGVSGGVDSMTLLYLIQRHSINCTVVHCNYRLRGEASEKDRELVEQISAMWNLNCITATFDPSEAENENTQEWARTKRYRVFRDLKKQIGADYIFTAHHQTDKIETILQKIWRGSGMASWNALDLQDGDLARPLIDLTKEQIKTFAEENHIPFREDETNERAEYARNFIRHDLYPEMDRFFPGWQDNVLKLTRRAEEFSIMADLLLDDIVSGENEISREKLLHKPEVIRPLLLHRFISKNQPGVSLSEGVINRFREISELQTGGEIAISTEWKIVRDRKFFKMVSKSKSEPESEICISRKDIGDELRLNSCSFRLKKWDEKIQPNLLQLDADKIDWPITVRKWRDGDRITPLGMTGSKLVADLLSDHKISTTQKRRAFLIESFDGIVSAVIFPHYNSGGHAGIISEQVKCSSGTQTILEIEKDL